jgi:hypothetical protein
MTIFYDLDVTDCPFLHRWTIITGDEGWPVITGQCAFMNASERASMRFI